MNKKLEKVRMGNIILETLVKSNKWGRFWELFQPVFFSVWILQSQLGLDLMSLLIVCGWLGYLRLVSFHFPAQVFRSTGIVGFVTFTYAASMLYPGLAYHIDTIYGVISAIIMILGMGKMMHIVFAKK